MSITSTALDGLRGAESQLERTAKRLSKIDQVGLDPQADNVDLSGAMAEVLTARNEYEADLRSLQTGDKMTRRTLDILA